MRRDHWSTRIEQLDPATDHHEIFRILAAHEFPWDITQALSFALFRTYAVPSIGALLARTGEFTRRAQKRYDDTALLLDAILEHGSDSPTGRTAVRRMNQMHRSYDISDEDMRYVLSTLVVMPVRWVDRYGYRSFTARERTATVNHFREVGRQMGIPALPATYQEFADLLDRYEREHFGTDAGGRAVADATLDLFATFPANRWLPRRLVRSVAYALMDDRLLDAFGYPRPAPWQRAVVQGALRLRGGLLRWFPARREPFYARQLRSVRSYPQGYDVAALGTFPHRPSAAGGDTATGEDATGETAGD
ncbi:MAG TPA: oxygenase MpaB family protein [Kineosporiaceae bacterium]|nr:oxygenase MpaB family protein [Kineosporiaceae bacterium]